MRNDELDQLLKTLHLGKVRQIIEEELLHVEAVFVDGPQREVFLLGEGGDALGENAEQLAIPQVGVQQVAVQKVGIMRSAAAAEVGIAQGFPAPSELPAQAEPPLLEISPGH